MSEKYFLGAMTGHGFSTAFSELMGEKGCYTYILKGGAGTGKSSLMKRVAGEFEENESVVRFYCSSDPASLDAVLLKESRVIIVDGTSPHIFDPVYPGCCQRIIDLGEFWDAERLKKNRDGIIAVTDKNKSLLARARRYTAALTDICYDSFHCALGCIDGGKLGGLVDELLSGQGSGVGRRDIRQLTALTEHGCMTQLETLDDYHEIYAICDEGFAGTHKLIELAAAEAVKRGFDVVLCPSHSFDNDIFEHLLIPEAGVAFISSSPITGLNPEGAKKIGEDRLYDECRLAAAGTRFKQNGRFIDELIAEIADSIKAAKQVHDEIEGYYIESMDYDGINEFTGRLIERIRERG